MSTQSFIPTVAAALCGALLLLGPTACKRDAAPSTLHAEARTGDEVDADAGGAPVADDEEDDDRYDAKAVARTGVQLDPDLARACNVSDAETFFAFDSTVVTSRGHDVLASVAKCLIDGPLRGKELELVGYTDPRGTDQYNQELGLERAESVAKSLRDQGVEPAQIDVESMGERAASNDASEWPSDRRVDIRIKPNVAASR